MSRLTIEEDKEPRPKRRRTDSGYDDLSQSSQVGNTSLKHQDSGLGSGTRACSPIYLSDEPEVTITDESKPSTQEPTITIYLGSARQQVAQSRYLSHIWKSGLDSPCAVCHQDFADREEPPIRTITFETSEELGEDTSDITQLPLAPHPIRVFNRHFKCLKAKRIKYIPISHVWHEGVSQAQVAREPTPNATRLGYQVPIRSLLALTKRYGRVEVWHDYISVPQWQTTTQQQLLLQLPSIYSYPDHMVMHLHDVSLSHLSNVLEPSGYSSFLESIAELTNSTYFERMWVVLEYIQSKKAMILSRYYDIFDEPAAELCDIAGANLGKYISRLGQNRFNELAQAKGFRWSRRACWDDQQTWKQQDPRFRTLGAAMFIIGQKTCRDHRDYFFSLRFLLNLHQDEVKISTILSDDTFESYRALCWDALKSGDYSPLLFLPLDAEETDSRAPWLRGHSRISHHVWDYGICRQLPKYPTIIRGDKIEPKLESIGAMQSFEHYDFFGSAESVFYKIARKIVDVSGPCAKTFHDTISRIFPTAAAKGVFSTPSTTIGVDNEKLQPVDLEPIRKLVERLSYLSFRGETRSEMLAVSNKLLSLLGLGLPEKQSSLSRIKAASEEAQWYKTKLEGLAAVKCKGCSRDFLFRATVWDPPSATAAAEMYRIPGLLYDDTVAEGVGLVVCGGLIVGKMAYGTPACDCRISEFVEFKAQRQ
ncbi:hypothetical protein F5B22DRAFT_592148 [Xylaria bambusicola]|uniref:uncharacterized protein n=1 Tax=Xylaria bambusicola TaxID=326684 RepID=UPI0020078E9D|nr:uncharacterized protein F5B22DRAFT_592148 [Xylaria bambusicola]KAI0523823.1 hypothetical protein F5B22DRAFT_592148 [Xylaria bambusicola]